MSKISFLGDSVNKNSLIQRISWTRRVFWLLCAMQILIIGGTRFIGPYVVRRLSSAGHNVSVFHRGKSTTCLPKGVSELFGDRNKLPEYRNVFKKLNPDIIVDMIPVNERHGQLVADVFSGIASRLVMVSSQDVYRAYGILIGIEQDIIQPTPLNEEAPVRKKIYPYRGAEPRKDDDPQKILDDYDKILIERIVMNNETLPGTVLRLPMVYGPGDYQYRLYEYVKRMNDKRPAIILEQELAAWRWTSGYVENVAEAIALAVENDNAKHRIYNVGYRVTLTTADWVKKIGEVIGWQGRVVVLPKGKLAPEMVPQMNAAQHLDVDTSRIRRELHFREIIPLEEAIKITATWELSHPPAKPVQFDYSAEDKVLKAVGL